MFNSIKQSPFRALLLFFILFINNNNIAQTNLVPNYSFENYTTCPSGYNRHLPLPWYLPTTYNQNGGEYSNACDTDRFASVPFNYYGGQNFQYARTGLAYIDLDYINGIIRSYAQIRLSESLKPGHFYYAEHFVNSPNPSRFSCNNIAMLFTDTAVYADTSKSRYPPILATPQVLNYGNPVIADTLNWIKVSAVFKAKGGEQYLTLGNFADNAHTILMPIQTNGANSAGYLIDDVSVYDLDSFRLHADAGRDTVINKGDSAWIGSYTNGIDTIQWLQNGTTVIDTVRPGFWVYPTSNTYYVLTQTVNGYTSRDTVYVTVAPLPVVIKSFKASPTPPKEWLKEQVLLSWETASEVNVSYFNVQRSEDGMHFNTVGKVNAKGASTYTFKDQTPFWGAEGLYYRLQIVDKNGALSYSEIKQLIIDNGQLIISPNPGKDFISISGGSIKEVRISDASGRVLLTSKDKKIDIRSLVSGVYYIAIETINGNHVVQKFIKLL